MTVEVPTDFFREYLEGAYLDIIKKTLKRVIGADARLVYLVHPVKAEQPMRYPASQGLPPVNRTVSVSTYNPANNPGPRCCIRSPSPVRSCLYSEGCGSR